MKITNVSPLGDLDIPLLGQIVPAGATVDVTAEQAAVLLPQTGNYAPGDDDAKVVLGKLLEPEPDTAPPADSTEGTDPS